jgi:hypothetical protein
MGTVGWSGGAWTTQELDAIQTQPSTYETACSRTWRNPQKRLETHRPEAHFRQGGYLTYRWSSSIPNEIAAGNPLQRRSQENQSAHQRESCLTDSNIILLFYILNFICCSNLHVFFFCSKATWMKPQYTKVYNLTLPNGKKVAVKSGTQVIDRFWQHLRKTLNKVSRVPGNAAMTRKIRSAQYTYWFRRQNMWKKAGDMLSSLSR